MPYPDSEYPSILRGKDKRDSQRLLAAAPALLAQLRMAAEFISGHNEFLNANGGYEEWNEYCVGLLEDCKAAIDKAEGRGE